MNVEPIMEKHKVILTDADGVLVTWLTGFEEFMSEKGYSHVPNTRNTDSMEARYCITNNEAYTLISEYNESPFVADLAPHADAVEYIGKLVEEGFKFVCITSIGSNPNSIKYRKENLDKLFGPCFLELICLNFGSSKKDALMPWRGSDLFWIEDHAKNAEQGHELGLKSILIRHEYNQHYTPEHFPVVGPDNPWKKIYEIVCKEYKLL